MIDILLKDGTIKKFLSLDKLDIDLNEIIYIHLIESNEEEMIELSNKFKFMPELDWNLGYPLSIIIMILSMTIILIALKLKKWI